MNFLEILSGKRKVGSKQVDNAIGELERKKEELTSQAEPIRAELRDLAKRDLSGESVGTALKEKRAEVMDLDEKIEAANGAIGELKAQLKEKLEQERIAAIESIDSEIAELRAIKREWRIELIKRQAIADAIGDFIEPRTRGFSDPFARDYSVDERRLHKETMEQAKKELEIDGPSLESKKTALYQERQALQMKQNVNDEELDTLAATAKK